MSFLRNLAPPANNNSPKGAAQNFSKTRIRDEMIQISKHLMLHLKNLQQQKSLLVRYSLQTIMKYTNTATGRCEDIRWTWLDDMHSSNEVVYSNTLQKNHSPVFAFHSADANEWFCARFSVPRRNVAGVATTQGAPHKREYDSGSKQPLQWTHPARPMLESENSRRWFV